ncbi:E3 ubiquitin-protein ligase TRIM33 [Mastacembelus armatus]|uniref:Tripartite motif containing 33, like n=1 Tax=Mastacembelus armatus TaxID=205130 RepID=A0A3Q3SJZ5_9TELE|nr:E3 ubiquitin-protein ligase TRIM33-like [Mastacembelus armatus]
METTGDPGNSFAHQCSSCDASTSSCWCLDCSEALCDDCVSAHRRVTVTRSHRLLNQPPAGSVSAPPIKFCRLHPSEPLKLFCFTCKQFTCRDCQLMAHMNHRYEFVTEASDRLKKHLENRAQPIRAQRDTVKRSLRDMEARLEDIAQRESIMKEELQASYRELVQRLKQRMDQLMTEVQQVNHSERQLIHNKMAKLKQLQESQQSVTETAEKAKNTNDLLSLLSYSELIESQMKEFLNQDLSPPQTMYQLIVVAERQVMENILRLGELQISWVPFCVSQTSNQNRDAPPASHTIAAPAPTNPTPTSSLPVSSYQNFNQSGAPCTTSNTPASSVPVNPLSSSILQTFSHTKTNLGQVQWIKNDKPASAFRPLRPIVSNGPPSTAPSTSCKVLIPQSLLQNKTAASRGVLLTNALTVYQLPSWPLISVTPQCPVVIRPTLSCTLPATTCPTEQKHGSVVGSLIPGPQTPVLVSGQTLSLDTAANCNSAGPSQMAVQTHKQTPSPQTLNDKHPPSSPLAPPFEVTADLSSLKHEQQSLVVKAVADSACDHSVPLVEEGPQEPAENEPTSTVCEETEPAEKLLAPERADSNAEEPGSVIGQQDYSMSQWQPRVCLYRLPAFQCPPEHPLSGFRVLPSNNKDEFHMEELSEAPQCVHADVSSHCGDEPPLTPESPGALKIVSCSACSAANSSIICVSCGRGYHRDCHIPPIGADIRSEWVCSLCQDLSDPLDPYSSERPQSPCLSLQDQRRFETVLLYLKVERHGRVSQSACFWSRLKVISERLTLHRSPPYRTAAEFHYDIQNLFDESSPPQDDGVFNKLQESFQERLAKTLLLTPTRTAQGEKCTESQRQHSNTASSADVKLKETRKRLKDFLVLTSGAKRLKQQAERATVRK